MNFATRRKLWNFAAGALVSAAVWCTTSLLVLLIGYICVRGAPVLSWDLLTGQTSYIRNTIGILPSILNTFYIIVVTMVIALPLGVGAAVYLTEYARPGRATACMEFACETLTGIPSIIFGLSGMLLFTRLLGLRAGILAGGLTLVMMILPVIVRTTQESLKTVPEAWRAGALALGCGKWRMVRTVVLPNALDGIVTGCILAIGRIVGESAALLFTAGFGLRLNGFFHSLQNSSATLTVALYVFASEQGRVDIAFGIAFLLLILTLGINTAASLLGGWLRKEADGKHIARTKSQSVVWKTTGAV